MAHYFDWGAEDTSLTLTNQSATAVLTSAASLSTDTVHGGSKALKMEPVSGSDVPCGVSASNSTPTLDNPYDFVPLNGPALYYRWWMRINTGFSWGSGGAQKVKISRTAASGEPGAPGGGLIYTGYMSAGGFDLSEGYWAGSDSAISTGGDHFADVNFDMNAYADSTWHEYIIKVKPNTTPTTYDGQFAVYIDGELIGEYNEFVMVSNLPNVDDGTPNWVTNYGDAPYLDVWCCMMLAPYWQMTGSGAGGTLYADDFAVDTTWNSTQFDDPEGGGGGSAIGERIISFGGARRRVRLT